MHVPGWHDATKQFQEQGKVQMVGIIQEQHPDRARLFMQWKQMGWPILVDSYNLLNVSAVPITLAIDEYGVVRRAGLPVRAAETIGSEFISRAFNGPQSTPAAAKPSDLARLRSAAEQRGAAADWQSYAEALALWGGPSQLSKTIMAFEQVLKKDPRDARAHFRLGVAYRMRYDSPQRQPDDFRRAVEQWTRALELNPNQYIWRRRIQQYGPRLEKPYPFYDWVTEARREIRSQGDEPVPLRVEPVGAELAHPTRSLPAATATGAEPDPQGKILRDAGEFVLAETIVVPASISAGRSARVHIEFRPNLAKKAHWNNEAGDLVVWLNPPDGWQVESRALQLPNPPQSVSQELRRVEFEVQVPENAVGRFALSAYALYYVCEDVNGVCLYRRQDLPITLDVRKPSS